MPSRPDSSTLTSTPRETLYRAKSVVTMDGPVIENGAVRVQGSKIAAVGPYAEVRRDGGETVDLGEVALLPGLVNAHCHLDFTVLRGRIAPQASFADWIRQINRHRASLSEHDYRDSIARGFEEAGSFGTTTIANIESVPALLAAIDPPPLRTWWFIELIDVRSDVGGKELIEKSLAHCCGKEHWPGGFGLSPHALYTVSPALLRLAGEVAHEHKMPLTMHVAESREEMEMFRDGRGELFDLLQSLGRPMDDCCRGKTPFALLLESDLLDESWILVHLNELAETDFVSLERAPRFHIAHCPRSGRHFGHTAFPLRRLQELGYNICLGTDSLASNGSLSLFAEMQALSNAHPWLAPKQILEMATVNGARALGQSTNLGKIRSGLQADLIAVPIGEQSREVFETIMACDRPVPWSMVGGRSVDRVRSVAPVFSQS